MMMTSEVMALAWEPETRSGATLFNEQWPCLSPHWAFHLFPHYVSSPCLDLVHTSLLLFKSVHSWRPPASPWLPKKPGQGSVFGQVTQTIVTRAPRVSQKAKNITMSFVDKCHINLIHNWNPYQWWNCQKKSKNNYSSKNYITFPCSFFRNTQNRV